MNGKGKKSETGTKGGAREGAGQPLQAKFSKNPELRTADPDAFLRALMADDDVDIRLRTQAALKLKGSDEEKPQKPGKKEQQAEQAKTATAGRFAPLAPPKLVAVK